LLGLLVQGGLADDRLLGHLVGERLVRLPLEPDRRTGGRRLGRGDEGEGQEREGHSDTSAIRVLGAEITGMEEWGKTNCLAASRRRARVTARIAQETAPAERRG